MRHLTTAFVMLIAVLAPAAAVGSSSPTRESAPTVSSAAADTAAQEVSARPKKRKKNRTRVKVAWSATSIAVTTPAWVSGTVKDKGKIKRKVVLQQKHADGWKKVGKDKTNRKGEFAIAVPSDWLYKMKSRVVTKRKKRSPAGKSKSTRIHVVANYAPAGSPDSWSQLNPQTRLRWNPCQAIPYRINVAQAPADTEGAIHDAINSLAQSTGLRFKFKGHTQAIYRGLPGTPSLERDSDLVIAWARPEQTQLDFSAAHAWGGTSKAVWGKDSRGRLGRILKGGTTFDVTTPGGWHYMKSLDVLLHELGHAVGLGHVPDPTQIMASGVEGPYIYGAGDLTGLNKHGLQKGCVKTLRQRRGDLPSPADAGFLVALP